MIFDNMIFMTTAASVLSYFVGAESGRFMESRRADNKRVDSTLDMTDASDQDRLGALIASLDGPVLGDVNIRRGKVVPTLRPKQIPELGRELRWLADRRRGNDFLLTDRHIKALIEAAVVVERVAEDRKLSRSLYKGLTDEEVKTIVRAAMMRVFPQCREGILAGESDEADCARVARAAVEQLFSIKGASA